jgi:hypothetical protein
LARSFIPSLFRVSVSSLIDLLSVLARVRLAPR